MASIPIRTSGVGLDFDGVRAEFALPATYPGPAIAEAQRVAAGRGRGARSAEDAGHLPLVTLGAAGSRDAHTALSVQHRDGGRGYRVHFAVADVAAFVPPGGLLDVEARRRGRSLSLPDGAVPLYPPVITEHIASLRPGETRRAVLWTVDCRPDGEPERVRVRRAIVRAVAHVSYDAVRAGADAGAPHPSLAALPELGWARAEAAVRRDAVEPWLRQPRIEPDGPGGWRVVTRRRHPVEAWHAEVTVLIGTCAARLMLDAGTGLLRTLPAPAPDAAAELRRTSRALGVAWAEAASAAHVLPTLDPTRPESLACHAEVSRLLGHGRYTAFDGVEPAVVGHAGIGAPYAHVTAPLRRMADRFTLEVCVAVSAGRSVPGWVRAALPELPALMAAADVLADRVRRTCLDQVTAWALEKRVGQEFRAAVVHADATGGEVLLVEPSLLVRCVGPGLAAGEWVRVRLVEADPRRRRVLFQRASAAM